MTDVKPERREAVMVFQNYLLFPYMSIEENVGFGLRMRRLNKQAVAQRVQEMLAVMKLEKLKGRKPVIVKIVVALIDSIRHFFSDPKKLLVCASRGSMQPPGSAPKSWFSPVSYTHLTLPTILLV